MKTFFITDTGVLRTMNQDYCFSSDTPIGNLPNLYIVCDGMGGHKAGEYASRYTAQRIVAHASRSRSENPVRILRDAIQKANEILLIESKEDEEKHGMGTTVVIATIVDHRMYVANVGDSRLYVIGETIKQITKDHSYVEEMVRMGKVDRADARTHEKKNVITRAVGVADKVRADIFEVDRIRDSLRELIKYLPKTTKKAVYTDFSDDINIIEHDDRRIEQEEFTDYKKKMNFYLRNHLDNEIISKIRNNEKISAEEIN